ncbi:MAG: VTT domain-containing protein [Bacteroidota bacterium]|nr:VTT domain-containing protein [Bacteroidota bacterium]
MFDIFLHSWFWHCVGLFFLTFVQEDAAIVAASFAMVEYGLPPAIAFFSIYFGIITGDLFIYGLGRVAQKSNWLRSKVIGPKVDKAKDWLDNNFVWAVAVCRITPTLLFPTYVAIGWFRMPVKRFILVTVITSAIYTPIVFFLVTLIGESVLYKLGYWAWGVILLVVVLFPLRKAILSFTKTGNGENTSALTLPFFNGLPNDQKNHKKQHRGMPSLKGLKRLVSFAERIPNGLFYIPVGLRWIILSIRYGNMTLPTLANPLIETGGFWGESKSATLGDIGKDQQKWMAGYFPYKRTSRLAEVDLQDVLFKMSETGIEFPLVAKPDIGWQGFGVRKVDDEEALLNYLTIYPKNESLLIQQLIPFDGEAGVFYARMPNEEHGKVFSLTLRYFPYVVGDGISTLRELIQHNPRTGFKAKYFLGKNPDHLGLSAERLESVPGEDEMVRLAFIGSIRIGGIYRDARYLITPELSARFDEIARSIPEFYYGRFDIRFKSTEDLKVAEGFSIIEINGAGSEPIHAWDPEVSLINLYRELFKAQSLMFRIAAQNRKRGFKTEGILKFIKAAKKQNKLIKLYPPAG